MAWSSLPWVDSVHGEDRPYKAKMPLVLGHNSAINHDHSSWLHLVWVSHHFPNSQRATNNLLVEGPGPYLDVATLGQWEFHKPIIWHAHLVSYHHDIVTGHCRCFKGCCGVFARFLERHLCLSQIGHMTLCNWSSLNIASWQCRADLKNTRNHKTEPAQNLWVKNKGLTVQICNLRQGEQSWKHGCG